MFQLICFLPHIRLCLKQEAHLAASLTWATTAVILKKGYKVIYKISEKIRFKIQNFLQLFFNVNIELLLYLDDF